MTPAHAVGFRVKSGFAVAIALRGPASAPIAVARRVVMMSDPKIPATKQPHHAGLFQIEEDTREIVRRVRIVERCCAASVEALLCESWLEGSSFRRAAIIVGSTIDPETVGNPHIRAHAYEGQLFRRVLEDALRAAGVRSEVIVEKQLTATMNARVSRRPREIAATLARFGDTLGRPWRADEKSAASAACTASQSAAPSATPTPTSAVRLGVKYG